MIQAEDANVSNSLMKTNVRYGIYAVNAVSIVNTKAAITKNNGQETFTCCV